MAFISYAYDISQDYKNYNGNQRNGAMALTTLGAGLSVGAGAIATFLGAPVIVVVGTGVVIDYVKKKKYGH